MIDTDTLHRAVDLIDKVNAADSRFEKDEDGKLIAKELLYANRMSLCLQEFNPQASPHLQLAVRAQHIERWVSPRSSYPEDRSGYKKWRADLSLHHAKRAADCLREAGVQEEDIARVQYLIQKRQMKRDPESQCLEDVVCLVFLRFYFEDFAAKHEDVKIIDILKKTWAKMSSQAQAYALTLALSERTISLVKQALSQ